MKPIRLMSGFFTVGVWTLLSRVLGFLREVLLLSLIGPGPVMDAFVAAFRLPNMFRRFFAEGAFNAAFVPMFSKRLEAGEAPEEFAANALSWLSFAVLTLTGLALVFMPPLFLGLLGAVNPRLMGYCLAFTIGNILLTMPGNGMDFSIDGFLGRAIALLLGLSTVVMAFRLVPGLPTTIRKRRLVSATVGVSLTSVMLSV